jgi:hypothetical protein
MAHAREYRYAPMCLCASLCTCACQPHCTCTSMTLCACLVQRAHICVPHDGVCVSHPNAPPATSERHEQAALTKLWDTMTPSHNRIPPCRGSMARRPYIWFLRPSAIDTGDSQNCESSSERRPSGPQKQINYKQTKKVCCRNTLAFSLEQAALATSSRCRLHRTFPVVFQSLSYFSPIVVII